MKKNDRGIRTAAHIVLLCMSVTVIVPLLLLISSSLTDEQTLIAGGYTLLPSKISLEAYRYMFGGAGNIFRAYAVTFLITGIGTSVGLFFTLMLGYLLSIRDLPGRRVLGFYVFFTMLFHGGLVPMYIMYTNMFHIKNTLWALIVPNLLVNAYFVTVARSYFESSILEEVLEAARIDGAGEARVLFGIVLPLSLPIIATLGLMIGLSYWNNWTNGLYFITDSRLFSIQQLLNEMMRNMDALRSGQMGAATAEVTLPSTSLKMAIAVAGVLPIMIVYPLFQKYFVKGMTLGAVKG